MLTKFVFRSHKNVSYPQYPSTKRQSQELHLLEKHIRWFPNELSKGAALCSIWLYNHKATCKCQSSGNKVTKIVQHQGEMEVMIVDRNVFLYTWHVCIQLQKITLHFCNPLCTWIHTLKNKKTNKQLLTSDDWCQPSSYLHPALMCNCQ